MALDDFGIIEPTALIPLSIASTGGPADLWMDFDGNPANDTDVTNPAVARRAGHTASYVGQVNGPTTVRMPGSVLRRGGTVRFYTVRNGQRSPVSAPVVMPNAARPAPRGRARTDEEGSMRIGVPKESRPGERLVAATPATVAQLAKLGYEVVVERGAGAAASFPDAAYAEAGAALADTAEVWASDVVTAVNAPGEAEIAERMAQRAE